ncbi:MAG TPA: hypothetical protein PK609_00115 [Candidatus Paceibacterota bacterium]|nr:hypothetical protein [Candidatus Paceibacterota bacterium]
MKLPKNAVSIIALVVVVVGAGVYFIWMREPATPNVSIDDTLSSANEAQASFLILAEQLEPVAFDASILSDPRFLALVDIQTIIVPEAAGREDPFARLPGVVE